MLIIAAIAIIGASCSAGTTTVTVDEDGNVVAIDGDPIPVEADGGLVMGPILFPSPSLNPSLNPSHRPGLGRHCLWLHQCSESGLHRR